MGDFVGHPFRGNQWTSGPVVSRGDWKASDAALRARIERTGFARPRRKGMVLVEVDVEAVDKAWEPNWRVGPGGTGAAIGDRYKRFKEWLTQNPDVPIEASEVFENNGLVGFSDGRHRFAVMRDLGIKRIKVATRRSDGLKVGVIRKRS